MKKTLSSLTAASLVLTAITLIQSPASATAVDQPVGGLEFVAPETVLPSGAVGDYYVYENVNGALNPSDEVDAKITILGTSNSRGYLVNDIELAPMFGGTLFPFFLDGFSTFAGEQILDDGQSIYASKTYVRYSLDGGETWNDHTTLDWEPIYNEVDYSVTNLILSEWGYIELPTATNEDDIQVEVNFDYAICDGEFSEEACNVTIYSWPSVDTYDAADFITDEETYSNFENTVHKVDRKSSSSTSDKYIRTSIESIDGAEETVIDYKVEFFDSSDNPIIFNSLQLNAYDVDNEQWVEFQNISSYLLTSGTILTPSQIAGDPKYLRFTSADVSASSSPDPDEVHSNGEARVQANFESVSEVYFSLGFYGSGGTQNFDFTAGAQWTLSSGDDVDPPASIDPESPSSEPRPPHAVSKPYVSVVQVEPMEITAKNEVITILGDNLNTVTQVYVAGVLAPIIYQDYGRLEITIPAGVMGLVDLLLKSPLNDLVLENRLNVAKRKAVLVVGGFALDSNKLTKKMKNRINRWLTRHSDLQTLTCRGYTSLPRMTADAALSRKRGQSACMFADKKRPELSWGVSKGVEDPRAGSNVRRVRLVLTP